MPDKIGVVVIEDNPAVRDLIADTLAMHEGMRLVGRAENGQRGLEVIRETDPQVVVLDLVMPELDGLAVLEALASDPHPPAVLVLTALGQEQQIRRARDLGAGYYMVKPFDVSTLADRVRLAATTQSGPAAAAAPARAVGTGEPELGALLREAGLLPKTKGYQYIRDAVALVLEADPGRGPGTMALYAAIAARYGTTPASVERAIRHAVTGAHRATGRRPPTNSQFLHEIVDRLRLAARGRPRATT